MPLRTTDWEKGTHVGGYSVVIDVRTPNEWQDDHIPGAINLPVLDYDQRHQVGLTYKTNSFEGRKLGASLIASSISKIIQSHFMDKDQSYKPLIYCWRGGKRSGSLALVLEQIGFEASVLEGGYKQYRAQVQAQLQTLPKLFEWRVLTGPTGSGKTVILKHLEGQGHQVLDLEGLAEHRGSVLGGWETPQPPQKLFESHLNIKIQNFDVSRPVWVEDEANTIGKIHVPKFLYEAVLNGARYDIALPLQERVKHLMQEYRHMVQDPEILKPLLARLIQHQGRERIAEWIALIDAREIQELVKQLLCQHYDPANARSIKSRLGKHQPRYHSVRLTGLDTPTLLRELSPDIFQSSAELLNAKDGTAVTGEQLWFHETAHTGFNSQKHRRFECLQPYLCKGRWALCTVCQAVLKQALLLWAAVAQQQAQASQVPEAAEASAADTTHTHTHTHTPTLAPLIK